MTKGRLLILVAFLVAIVVSVRLELSSQHGPSGPAGTAMAAPPATSKTLTGVGDYRGIALSLPNADPNHPYETFIDEIAATGANTILFVLAAYQENASSTSIFIDMRKTPSDAHLKRIIGHARSRGLRVMMMPIVLLENPRDSEWRGKINPSSWDDWWQDYENYLMHYAYIANETGVEVFMVGSELLSTETDAQLERWKSLIKTVRGGFSGKLGYSSNWDHYSFVKFWDHLDVVGMTTYHDLTDGGKEPTMDRLMAEWKTIKRNILDWQKTVNRPIVFTEVGWPNQTTCAEFAWDYTRSTDSPAPELQARCFEAFFRTWSNEPAVAGAVVWEWRCYEVYDEKGHIKPYGPDETSYVPCGKPALEVIKRYLARPLVAAASGPASAPGSQPIVTDSHLKEVLGK